MDIYFILVEPAVPENIGASARAINTMGFQNLRLVNPKNFPHEKASWVAHGSADILDQAGLYSNLGTAIEDLDFVIATSAKKRAVKWDHYPLEVVPELILSKGTFVNTLGVVFGREEFGLKNQEINLCDMVSYIPLHRPYPSLNLAQAVMLYAYHLSGCQGKTRPSSVPGHSERYRAVREKTQQILCQIGILENDAKHGRILERLSVLSESDLHLILSVTNALDQRLN